MKVLAIYLAERTYTPIPYWLGLPIGELFSWAETVNEREEKSHVR